MQQLLLQYQQLYLPGLCVALQAGTLLPSRK